MTEGGVGVEIQQPVQEKVDPVKEYANLAEANWFDLFHFLGRATHKSRAGLPAPVVNPQKVERSLHTRVERARFLKQLKSGEKTRADLAEMHDLDTFDRQFLSQGNLSIDIPGLGIQGSRYAVIELPSKKEAAESKPPIFLVPALSGDLNGVAPLMREAALQGRKVVAIGYPESFMGKTTEAFAQASQVSPNFEPHTTYFKRAIEALVGTEGDLELWGYSTGGGLVTEILNDPKFQQRVSNAVIIAPGGSIEQSRLDVIKGVLHEFKEVFKRPGSIHDTAVAYARKTPLEAAHKALRNKIFLSTLFTKVGRRINAWEGIKVREGGKIVIVTGRKDEITKSYKVNQDLSQSPNSQIRLLEFSEGSHLFPLTAARAVVGKIAEVRDNPQAPRYTVVSEKTANQVSEAKTRGEQQPAKQPVENPPKEVRVPEGVNPIVYRWLSSRLEITMVRLADVTEELKSEKPPTSRIGRFVSRVLPDSRISSQRELSAEANVLSQALSDLVAGKTEGVEQIAEKDLKEAHHLFRLADMMAEVDVSDGVYEKADEALEVLRILNPQKAAYYAKKLYPLENG